MMELNLSILKSNNDWKVRKDRKHTQSVTKCQLKLLIKSDMFEIRVKNDTFIQIL